MTRKLVKREQAKRDLIGLADYIAHDNLDAAERFLDAANAAIRFLARTPGAGAKREYLNPALDGLRMWPVKSFEKHLIFYRVIPNGLEIVRVLHSARDIEAVFEDVHHSEG
jgi:toxin ParE1/3/4